MGKYLLSFCMIALLSACGGQESDAKNAVLLALKDPDSAKFGQFTIVDDNHACLTVNSRNSMGGYVGNQDAYLVKENGYWGVVTIDGTLGHGACVAVMKAQINKK